MSCLCAVRGAHVSVSPVLTRCANAVRPGACCALCLEQNNHRRAGHEAEIPNLDRYVQGRMFHGLLKAVVHGGGIILESQHCTGR